MDIAVGQVWQDHGDLLFITDIGLSDDRIKVEGTAILNGVVARYTHYYRLPNGFDFGRLRFDPSGEIPLDRTCAIV